MLDERGEHCVDLDDLGFEGDRPSRKGAQCELGARVQVASLRRPVAAGAFEEPVDVEVAQFGADVVGAVEMIERI